MQLSPSITKTINELDLDSLLPPSTQWHACHQAPLDYQLYPQETALTAKMLAKRLAEFRGGRYCAQQALKQLNILDFPLIIGDKRQPLWPDSIVGSISHCQGICIAVVDRQLNVGGIGIDIEQVSDFDSETLNLICNANEISHLQKHATPLLAAKVVFSVKESIYKCLFPNYQKWIDFLDVEVRLDWQQRKYSVKFNEDLRHYYNESDLKGGWQINQDYILSSCWYNN